MFDGFQIEEIGANQSHFDQCWFEYNNTEVLNNISYSAPIDETTWEFASNYANVTSVSTLQDDDNLVIVDSIPEECSRFGNFTLKLIPQIGMSSGSELECLTNTGFVVFKTGGITASPGKSANITAMQKRDLNCSETTTSFEYVLDKNSLCVHALDEFGLHTEEVTSWDYSVLEKDIDFNNETIEGATETFIYNFTKSSDKTLSKVDIIYDGTTYTTTSSVSGDNIISVRNLVAPSVVIDTNKTFYFMITYSDSTEVNSTTSTQLVKDLQIDNCAVYTNTIFNFTLLDEELQTNITSPPTENTTIEVDMSINTYGTSTEVLNITTKYENVNPAQICLNENLSDTQYSVDAVIKYEGDLHSIEYYNIQGFTLEQTAIPQSINLYDINLNDATEFKITFKDENYLPLENALVQFNRQYVSEGVFKTVEVPKTDSNGQAVAHLDEKNVRYNIIVTKDGEILATFTNIVAFCEDITTGLCEINLQQSQSETEFFDYSEYFTINYAAEYNETTRDISFTYSTVDGSSKNVTVVVDKFDILGGTNACTESLTSASGTIICSVPASIGDVLMTLAVYVDSEYMVEFSVNGEADKPFGNDGYFMFMILFAMLVMMLSGSKTMMIIGSVLGFVIAGFLSLTSTGSAGVIGSLIWLVVAAFILIWKMNQGGKDQ